MERIIEAVMACPLFAGVEKGELSALLDCVGARTVRSRHGESILAEGDPARYLGVLLSGSAQVERVDYFGNRDILARLEPGEIFGESFACAGVGARPVSVVAAREAEALLLEAARLTGPCGKACAFHGRVVNNLLRVLAEKNLAFHRKLTITGRKTTREKLMAYLLYEAKRQGSSRVRVPFDRQALADYLGVDRSGLSAQIGQLRRQGVLTARKNEFTLLNPPE